MYEQKKETRKTRRLYAFNYDDLGYVAGISGKATREWMKRRGLRLDGKNYAGNLEIVVQFLNDRRGISRTSLIQTSIRKEKMANGVEPNIKNYGGAKIEDFVDPVALSKQEIADVTPAQQQTAEDRNQTKLSELRVVMDGIKANATTTPKTSQIASAFSGGIDMEEMSRQKNADYEAYKCLVRMEEEGDEFSVEERIQLQEGDKKYNRRLGLRF